MDKEMVEVAQEGARKIIELTGKELVPVLLIKTEKGECQLVVIKNFNGETFSRETPNLLRKLKVVEYVLITEAWITKLDKDSPVAERVCEGSIAVHELPPDDRQEIAIITHATNGKLYEIFTSKITYLKERKCLGKWEPFSTEKTEGRMMIKNW